MSCFSLVAVAYEGVAGYFSKDALCVARLIHFQSPSSLLSLGAERHLCRCCSCRHCCCLCALRLNCFAIRFWAAHQTFGPWDFELTLLLALNLQIAVVWGATWVLCNANPFPGSGWVCGRAYPSAHCQLLTPEDAAWRSTLTLLHLANLHWRSPPLSLVPTKGATVIAANRHQTHLNRLDSVSLQCIIFGAFS